MCSCSLRLQVQWSGAWLTTMHTTTPTLGRSLRLRQQTGRICSCSERWHQLLSGAWEISFRGNSPTQHGAFATAGQHVASLFAALAKAAEWRTGDFKLQGLTNTAWAFAMADQVDASLFAAMAATADRRVVDFNPQNFANSA